MFRIGSPRIRAPRVRLSWSSVAWLTLVMVGVLPLGAHRAVSAVARATPVTNQADLEDGDLLVGAGTVALGDGRLIGAILRIRDTDVTPFCESTHDTASAEMFTVPTDVLVDSAGRVVFVAPVPAFGYNLFNGTSSMGLFRCNTKGQAPEKLAIFPAVTTEDQLAADTGFPVPFPGQAIMNVGSLHLKRLKSLDINDAVAGHVTVANDDVYVMVAALTRFQEIDYHVATGLWEQRELSTSTTFSVFPLPSMVNHAGTTYTAWYNVIAADTEPLEFKASGTILGTPFTLDLGLFGGHHEVRGILTDNQAEGHLASQCKPTPPYSLIEPFYGDFNGRPLSNLDQVAYDEKGGLGQVVTTNYGPTGSTYLTNIGQALLNADPNDDPNDIFLNDSNNCQPTQELKFLPVVPVYADNGVSNAADHMGATTSGLVGTQLFAGRVIRIGHDGHADPTIVSGLNQPRGITGYPSVVADGGGLVLVLRIDSPVDVLLVAPDGRRVGVDVNHESVNDFGEDGYVGPPGEPRLIAVRGIAPGDFRVDAVGTGDGPYTFHAYAADLSKPAGRFVQTSGIASIGMTTRLDFSLAGDGALAFSGIVDVAPPVLTLPANLSTEAIGPAGSTAAYTVTAVDAVDGVVMLVCSPASGTWFALGRTTVQCAASDRTGNTATGSFTVTVTDTTPPALTVPDNISAIASGSSGAPAAYVASATDLVDGVVVPACAPLSGSVFAIGTTLVRCTAVDTHGNSAVGTFTITITQPASITSPDHTTLTVGTAGAFLLSSGGSPTPTLSEVGALPVGLTFADNHNGTARLSGTPGAHTGGTRLLTFVAANGVGPDASQAFTLAVNEAPTFTAATPPSTGTIGTAYSYTFAATGYPAPVFAVAAGGGLPPGLSLNPASGALAGSPTAAGTFVFAVTAGNAAGSVTAAVATVVVVANPPTGKADLFVSVSGPLWAGRGATSIYTATVTNRGPATAANVQVTIALLGAEASVIATAPPGTQNRHAFVWSVPAIASGQQVTDTMTVKFQALGLVVVETAATSQTPDPKPLGNLARALTWVW
jgi:hypothetical protein